MGKEHFCPDLVHYYWDNSIRPILTILPGDTVVYEFRDAANKQLTPESGAEDVKNINWDRFYPLTGPVYVEGAKAGDILQIEILDLCARGYGWTYIRPESMSGLLDKEFDKIYLRTFPLDNTDHVVFREDIRIPIRPCLGVMGVAPADSGRKPTAPPEKYGGNMDIRHLTKGARLFLPVQVEGALFSAGDGHAVQGDGELCGTALECSISGKLKIDLIKGKHIPGPQFITPSGSLTPKTDSEGFFATTGIGKDLLHCAKKSLRAMIDYLVDEKKMSRQEAYLLCSLVVDLKISEVVNPNFVVSAYLPLNIFR